MEIKGYYTYGAYMGYVGKETSGANSDGYMEFASEDDYLQWVK